MNAVYLAIASLAITSTLALATAQIGEFLEYNGKQVEIYSTPLESYLEGKEDRPDFPASSTACWRGYVGLWRIEDSKLLLVSLHDEDWDKNPPLGKEFPLSKVFPESKNPIEATWFSGVLRIPEGEQLRYVHMGFGTVFERDRYITIKKGVVTATKIIDNKGFGATKSTPDLQWVALAEKPVEDAGDWTDARTLFRDPARKAVLVGEPISTRGIYFGPSGEEPASLWIPSSPTTDSVYLRLAKVPPNPVIANGSHVEIKATYSKKTEAFAVTNIKALEPGKSMHHPEFKPAEQDGAGQPATALDSKLEGDSKPQPESEGHSQ